MLPCVILAGGLGTRMRPFTATSPKALVPVLGRPFADWQLEWLKGEGVSRVIYSVGYRGDAIRCRLGSGRRYGLSIRYVEDGSVLRGTGGALRAAADQGALPEAFFLLYGDSYPRVSLVELERTWRNGGRVAAMAVYRNEGRWDESNAVYRDGRVLLYDKGASAARPDLRWIDCGVSVLRRAEVIGRIAPGRAFDIAQLLHELSLEGSLDGLEARERFYEAGSVEGLRQLEAHLSAAT